jgi:mandelate racemase
MTSPKIRSVRVRTARVPLPVPHTTASGTVAESPLVLTDVVSDDGSVGHSIVFTYTPVALKPVADLLSGFRRVDQRRRCGSVRCRTLWW